jgi:integrase
MTLKNRERLAQFDVPGQLDRFMFLPEQLMAAALRIKNPTATEALVAQDALLLAILQYVPIRIGNVAVLEMGKSLIVSGQTGRIVLGREEVKNKVDLDWPLSSHVVGLIQIYLKRFHPLVSPPGCPMLFSSRSGSHKDPSVLGRQVTKRVRNEIGIEFNAHLARHLAAKLMLDLQPGAYGIVKQVLSHKQIQTTIDAYCGTEDQAAFNLFTAMVDKRRDAVGGGAR